MLHPLSSYLPHITHVESAWDTYGTRDRDEINRRVASLFCEHELEPVESHTKLDYAHGILRGNSVAVIHMRYGGAVWVRTDLLHVDTFVLAMPISGNIDYCCGHETGTARRSTALLPKLDEKYSFLWSADCESLVVLISRAALENHLSSLLQKPLARRLDFDVQMAIATQEGSIWQRTIRNYIDHLQQIRNLPAVKWLLPELEDLLLSTLLHVQPNNYSQALETSLDPVVLPRRIREASEYIQANAKSAITMTELVTVTGISSRGLRSAFKKHYGCTPLQYLRSVRLDYARKELLESGPRTTVTDVASRCGFDHFGRFAEAYKRAFGELPSDTLRR